MQICFLTTAIVAALRMDAVAFLYVLWLFLLFALSRPVLARVWYFYVLFLVVLFPIQYAASLGLPEVACIRKFIPILLSNVD